ncbi:hypothetical protein [Pseudomonas sp. CC120222-01a]|uniref:hypothetical protein n=1 Tax=Pseudomonas sp. CC120222-01a TaxID=1378075 RepID=UPI000D9DEE8A|nr:hypothetical protein [Pseudomonas sp. CC120222-01a]PVZ42589.1 hypothetical protein N430_01202 [Pseudomonas sp. CC120222-01a]
MPRYEKRQYSITDLERVIAINNERLNREPDDFTASWLLEGNIGSDAWKTSNGDKHVLTEEGWKHTKNVNFNVRLPDDSLLTDSQNTIMLHAIQKTLFYIRSGSFGIYPGPAAWGDHIQPIFNLASYMYLDKERFMPDKFGFNLLNEDALKHLVTKLAQGGWENALEIIPRTLDKLHIKALGQKAPDALHKRAFNLPENVRSKILDALFSDRGFIKYQTDTRGKSPERIPTNYIKHIIGKPGINPKHSKLVVFLAQFNNETTSEKTINDYLRTTQHPRTTTRLLDHEPSHPLTEATLTKIIYNLNNFFKGKHHPSTTIPNINYNPQELRLLASQYINSSQHKQLIPLRFGLKILRKSTEFVIVYGDALIDCCLEYIRHLHNENPNKRLATRMHLANLELPKILEKYMTLECPGLPSNNIGDALKIRCAKKNLQDLDPENLTLNQALGLLICAQSNIICMLKPLRISELISLRRDCAMYDTLLGGAWMESTVGKTGLEGINMEFARPIPKLTLKAISQLQYLGMNLAELFEDTSPHATDDLFYIPSMGTFKKSYRSALKIKLSLYTGLFHDYIDSPIDEHGRRFYPGPHEFRKFFILMMYWHEQNIGFSCAAWMAGHRLTEHTQAYTDASVSAEEISLWEAECIEDKIIELEAGRSNRQDVDGLVALYNAVKARFGVGRVEGLQRKAYIEFLQDLRAEGTITIKPYFIFAPGCMEPDGIDLAFKYEDKQDEQF